MQDIILHTRACYGPRLSIFVAIDTVTVLLRTVLLVAVRLRAARAGAAHTLYYVLYLQPCIGYSLFIARPAALRSDRTSADGAQGRCRLPLVCKSAISCYCCANHGHGHIWLCAAASVIIAWRASRCRHRMPTACPVSTHGRRQACQATIGHHCPADLLAACILHYSAL